ncbi:MAG: hypothetical protein IKT31_03955, partial [Firmicutes bacterium]|nr:hypothetical protein [Bacillota bacterium]
MSMTDRYIISQVRLIALELVGLGVILLVFWVTVMNGSGSQFDPAAQRWENGLQTVIRIFLPVFCLLWMLLLYRIYKKLFWSSLFGPSAVLYQSLPVSMTAAVSGKILLSGFCILLPGAVVLPRLGGIMVSGLMNGL